MFICRLHDYLCRKSGGIYKELLELIKKEFSKIAGWKFDILKSPAFPYTRNKQAETEVKNK